MAEEFGGASLKAFVTDLRARFAEEDEARGVVLLTYHRAKGLEFDVVFLPRLEDKELPFALARTDEDLAEERRLFYVGITRARRTLVISWAASRPGERRSRPKPSSFLGLITPGGDGAARLTEKRHTRFGEPRRSRPADDVAEVVAGASGDPLFVSLRDWRLRVSKDAGVPAYVVFDNRTLALIAAARPATRAALLAVPGVGPTKLDRYAEDVLQIVRSA
jgi:DNA helicase-2/ATP-dependent DNA helicase PcrA